MFVHRSITRREAWKMESFRTGFERSSKSAPGECMDIQHRDLAGGRWHALSLAEQLGNVGSEVHRAVSAEGNNDSDFHAAFTRALELFDLTLADPRHRKRLKEIARARELLCDAAGQRSVYQTTLEDNDAYLLCFAMAAHNASRISVASSSQHGGASTIDGGEIL